MLISNEKSARILNQDQKHETQAVKNETIASDDNKKLSRFAVKFIGVAIGV